MAATASSVRNFVGEKLYQVRARQALPILVRQATSEQSLNYEKLADELGMPNPRNLNWVLGSVGVSLNELSAKRGWRNRPVPHIQSLVINKNTGLPGSGFDGFLAKRTGEYKRLSKDQKRAYLKSYWNDIFAYPHWGEVLEAFELEPAMANNIDLIAKARTGTGRGGGEGPQHLALKKYISNNPGAVGLPTAFGVGTMEVNLPSGDRIDVLFESPDRRFAVEVKSEISNNVDIVRGLFQCVKYRAVLKAERGSISGRYKVDAVLVLGCSFPSSINALRNSLGVRVIEVVL
jgi:hypothetical protein